MAEKKSAFDTPWFNSQSKEFFNTLNKPENYNIVLTSDTEDFDEETSQQWRDEGFQTTYVPALNGGDQYIKRVHNAGDGFGAAEYYCIVAYGDAAKLILQAHIKPSHPKLAGIVAYYPSTIPSSRTKYPAGVKVLVHLAGKEVDMMHQKEALGIQGKLVPVKKDIEPGPGYGECVPMNYRTYTYAGAEPGFAERDLEEFDAIAEDVAFTRSLETVRRALRWETEVERTRDAIVDQTASGDTQKAMESITPYAHIVYGPTLTGGVGTKDLEKFYTSFFQPLPPTFRCRLLSRTIGTDGSRVVDEIYITFTHSQALHWILPGIPATNKKVEIIMVSIVKFVGGRLESEHVYWDQASVLVQVGLLSAEMVPQSFKKKGVEELPIWGVESARGVKRGGGENINVLIEEWED
ncbi:hypothetical protein LTR56_018436 [Elasticomyces elasticus]|nr:hypothetical protein LTR56_018436 [Elasticomyces elasticus]KAK3655784.1 hypothetical protein LTR22_010078 [Elasticomyces elasticus]KAK4911998.1 hypothetical protein LTR49_019468 [Elasticomyces elasticus]KAK5756791.1 hypothetical protein LTS12_013124 [Elasticomyces elasticus]